MNRRDARVLTDMIRDAVSDLAELARQAAEGRAWEALGYASWDDWADTEFGQYRVKLPTPERREQVRDMTGQGMSTRQQAKILGVGQRTVVRDQHATDEPNDSPEKITGRDGKTYPRAVAKRVTDETPLQEMLGWAEAEQVLRGVADEAATIAGSDPPAETDPSPSLDEWPFLVGAIEEAVACLARIETPLPENALIRLDAVAQAIATITAAGKPQGLRIVK